MSTAAITKPIAEAAPAPNARLAGIFYLLTFIAGATALFVRGTAGLAANLIAGACYVAVTLLFYFLFKPVNRKLSLAAAFISLLGCVMGALSAIHLVPTKLNPLAFFGVYCLLIGYLIFQSNFMPRFLGALMAFGGVGWLTFVSPALASQIAPYNLAPGLLGEGALTLWLLVMGVNVPRWQQQAGVPANEDPGSHGSKPFYL
jgi:hypothetical protein